MVDDADVGELNEIISKIEDFRSRYRMKHNELKHFAGDFYDDLYSVEFKDRIAFVKRFIMSCKDAKRVLKDKEAKIRDNNAKDSIESKRRSFQFLIKEINKMMTFKIDERIIKLWFYG